MRSLLSFPRLQQTQLLLRHCKLRWLRLQACSTEEVWHQPQAFLWNTKQRIKQPTMLRYNSKQHSSSYQATNNSHRN